MNSHRYRIALFAFIFCIISFFVVLSMNIYVAPFDLDNSERYTASDFQLNITNLRKQWVKDAFQQFDVYACEHIFLPFCVMIFSANASFTLLLVYVYESYLLAECLWVKSTCTYFTRSTDCLIQDPIQGACAVLIAYLVFDPKPTTSLVAKWQSWVECIVLLALCLNPYLEFLELGGSKAQWPTTQAYNFKYPIFAFLYALYFNHTSQDDKLKKTCQCAVGYVLVWFAQLCAWAGREYDLIQPMQSSPLWFLLLGSACSLVAMCYEERIGAIMMHETATNRFS